MTRFGRIRRIRHIIDCMDRYRSIALLRARNMGLETTETTLPLNVVIKEVWNRVYCSEELDEKAYTEAVTSLNKTLNMSIPTTIGEL